MSKVRVVDTVYTIVHRVGVKDDDGNPAHGTCHPERCEIAIEANAAPARKTWTKTHELAHAVWQETGMGPEMAAACGAEKADLLEEDIIRRFVPALIRTLRDARVIR